MPVLFQGLLALVGRVLLVLIFLMSAVGNKLPHFNDTVAVMETHGVPVAPLMLCGAILFLLGGSGLVIFGYHARFGALLLAIFLALATFYFHDFWNQTDEKVKTAETIQFMKNLSMFGAMLLVMANGAGPLSIDERRHLARK